MWVVGLGNPGIRYAGTRHNVGHAVVLRLVDRWRARRTAREPAFEAFRAALPGRAGRTVTLLMPLAYMNRSGEALGAYESWSGERLVAGETLVLCDDIYLPVGEIRIRPQGTTGGHRGLESVERRFGTLEYPRLRIGVGAAPGEQLVDHVLSSFEEAEREALVESLERAAEAAEIWAVEGAVAAMNRFNRRSRG